MSNTRACWVLRSESCGTCITWLQVKKRMEIDEFQDCSQLDLCGLSVHKCTHGSICVCVHTCVRVSVYLRRNYSFTWWTFPGPWKKIRPHKNKNKTPVPSYQGRNKHECNDGCSFLLMGKLPVNFQAVHVQAGVQLALHCLMLTHLCTYPPLLSEVKRCECFP